MDKVSDSDPQKYEIVVRLTVTDNKGATDSDTVSININQRPVAVIQVYAGLRDDDIVDADLGARGHFPDDAVIDGPGENGNRDNEWDIMEGAYLQLSGAGSTDEGATGRPSAYQWTRVRPADADGYADGQTASASPTLKVAEGTVDDSNKEVITFVGVDENDDDSDDTLPVYTLPDVPPNDPQTVFYQLTVCDSRIATTDDISVPANCEGLTGAALIRIVVHDTSATPEVSIEADLTTASMTRGNAEPQATVGRFTGVENQFIVDAGSTVLLTAKAEDDDQDDGHIFRWSGATALTDQSMMATVRVPADADDGDTIEGSVTVTDETRISVTTDFQLLVGENTPPTAGGVPANQGSIDSVDNPQTPDVDESLGGPVIWVHSVTDGFQNQRVGSTVTLRGVGNDADGDSIITAWALREGPMHDAFNTAIGTWLDAEKGDAAAKGAADGAALGVIGAQLRDMQTPDDPLLELNGALADTVSFDVPNLKNGESKGTILIFSVIDSNGVSANQLVYVHVRADDNVPNADAGADQQVDPEAFVRLNGSASSDPDVGDKISYEWEYVGATMDPAPNERSPLSADEIKELRGWILPQDFAGTTVGTADYIVTSGGQLKDGVMGLTNLKSTSSPYPYFDAPDLTGFNNIKLTFKLTVTDSADSSAMEINGVPLNPDAVPAEQDDDAKEYDTAMVTITVVNRFFSGDVSSPDFCTGMSLGGPSTYAFDSDGDGVADVCALNTTRRATVARQNALETLAGLNRNEFRTEVLGVCGSAGFKQKDYGDDPSDLETDVCETERVTPPPAAADPATADVFFSGTVTGPDYCTNHSLGGARTYANDSDGDGVADICSLATTRREAVARQRAMKTFIESFSGGDELADLKRLLELHGKDSLADGSGDTANEQGEYDDLIDERVDKDDDIERLTAEQVKTIEERVTTLEDEQSRATRYSDALAAACRALGSQDFGDSASALAGDECVPTPRTGQPLG